MLIPCLFAATALLFGWRSVVESPVGSIVQPGPGWWPLVLSVFLFGASLLLLWERAPQAAEIADAADEPPAVRGGPLLILAAGAFAALALQPLGYRPTILLVLLFFLGVVERKRPLAALVVACALSFGSYAILVGLLRLRLPVGFLSI